ncbi:transposase [Microbacterium sp. ET2]|uniref:transposase n=1 Tax=Microbacterium albipurpureum TaxID=3050384 RepID=UPI00259C76E2|nr:transposase [Microbacterium sp. ET2 (Ac-2212)]WJL96838.1 transposase [Microbacterium sp. ET2 (Ac-2212)]
MAGEDSGGASGGEADELDAVAAELYALRPDEFTAARNARALAAPRALGSRIRSLRKPAASAWAVDLLAREGRLTEVLDLAAALREAQDDLDAKEMQRLGRERRALVQALARQAVTLAAEHGVTVSAAARDDVAATITAALLDPLAGAAVATGRLIRPLEATGVDPVDLSEAVGGSIPGLPDAAARPERTTDDLAARRARKAAEQAVRAAERGASDAERELTRAEALLATATERADHLSERVEELRAQLARVEKDARAAADARKAAAAARTAAAERVEDARRTLETARRAVPPA